MKRRGISPVIAVLLLIVIAVAAAILTYVWISGYVGTLQAQAGAQQLQERIKIDGVEIRDNKITGVYVRNIGDVEVTIDAVYVLDTSGNILGATIGVGATITAAGASHITSVSSPTLQEGHTYIVKVVTTRGTEVTYQFTYRA